MNLDRELQTRFAYGSDGITREEYDAWAKRSFEVFNGVLLFGTEKVRPPMEPLREAHGRVYTEFMRDTTREPFGEKMKAAYQKHVVEIVEWREACLKAMREDVAPPSAS